MKSRSPLRQAIGTETSKRALSLSCPQRRKSKWASMKKCHDGQKARETHKFLETAVRCLLFWVLTARWLNWHCRTIQIWYLWNGIGQQSIRWSIVTILCATFLICCFCNFTVPQAYHILKFDNGFGIGKRNIFGFWNRIILSFLWKSLLWTYCNLYF